MIERVLTPAELCGRLRVSRNTAYNLLASGAIRHVRIGVGPNAPIRIPESAVVDYLAGQPVALVASVGGADS